MRIIFFNHKGGVSKTTTTFNLGWKLAQHGNRVLLVDADPQCNLTGLILRDNFERYYSDAPTNTRNIMNGVSSAFESRPEPIQAFDCYNVPENTNLFLLPGHPNLTELEPALSFAQASNNAFATMQNLPGAFHALISLLTTHHSIDYVLIDLNPGLGALNQNLFSISDLFIIPTNPDPFSLMAIRTLSNLLPRWYQTSIQMRTMFNTSAYPFPNQNPKFAGVVIQRFNIRSGRPATPYRNNMDEILAEIQNTLVPKLRTHGMLLEDDLYRSIEIPANYCLAEIPDFQSLIQQSNLHGIPVFALSDAQMDRTGTVLRQMQERRSVFDTQFDEFATLIESIKEMLRAKQRFDDAIVRIRGLDGLYTHLTTTLHFPATDVADILRSEIVYAVSAFDKLVHDLVKQGMIETFLGTRTATPAYKNFTVNLSQLEAMNNATTIPSPVDIFENIIIDTHRHQTFQDPDKITPALSLIWLETHKWQRLATCMGKTENDVKVELKNIVLRRNQIVHEGDLDLFTGTLQTIRQQDVSDSVNFINDLANCIYSSI